MLPSAPSSSVNRATTASPVTFLAQLAARSSARQSQPGSAGVAARRSIGSPPCRCGKPGCFGGAGNRLPRPSRRRCLVPEDWRDSTRLWEAVGWLQERLLRAPASVLATRSRRGEYALMHLRLHANATTTPRTRAYIQKSTASNAALAHELGIHACNSSGDGRTKSLTVPWTERPRSTLLRLRTCGRVKTKPNGRQSRQRREVCASS
jgi:hypothetical protein